MVSVGRITARQHPLEEIFDVVEELYQEFVVVNFSSGACEGIGFGARLSLSGVGHGSFSCCLRDSILAILKILLAIPNVLSQVVPPDVLL